MALLRLRGDSSVKFDSWGFFSRCISSSSQSLDFAEMMEAIVGGVDVEERLSRMKLDWSPNLASRVILSLSDSGASAIPFFTWAAKSRPELAADPKLCNLIVDNLGRLEDYARMTALLTELSRRGHSVTDKAFVFLKKPNSDSVRRVAGALRAAGGSCRSSGVFSLIKFLADGGGFELAIMLMEEMVAPRVAYFNALIAAKCRRGDFDDAHQLLDEMRLSFGCDPTVQSFNYLLGAIFKRRNFGRAREVWALMEAAGCAADELTYEMGIVHACRAGREELAGAILARMVAAGVRPRLTVHAAFIKSFFWSGRLDEARRYVGAWRRLDPCATNTNYSLLASLLRVNGQLAEAAELLHEMMAAHLRPNFSVYVRLAKDLYRAGRGDLAASLKLHFSELTRHCSSSSSSSSS
ncbi:uncharacterized protein LOC144704243 [Wolffia australiana]